MSYRYQITVSDEAQSYLESLLVSGIFGRSIPDVIKRLVDAALIERFIMPPNERLKIKQ